MSQLKTKQVAGLDAALALKVESATNVGTGNQGIFKQKNGTNLELYKIGTGLGVSVSAPASDIITFNLDLSGITDELTSAAAGDRIAIQDASDSNKTKYITKSNFQAGLGGGPVSFGDYTAEPSTQSTDNIIFFDDSDTDSPKVQTKAQFLADYAPLASPALTGNPTAPTQSPGTDNTNLATTAFVKQAVDNALTGLDYQPDVLDIQTDNTLDPGASPTTGDRYLITNAASLHANFGTITGIADDDIAEYDGANFVVAYDVSVEGEGALVWDRNSNEWYRWDGTSWDTFGGIASLVAGAGLTKTSNTLDVNVDNSSIQIVGDALQIHSSWAGSTSLTTLGTITTGTWNGTAIAVNRGGTGLTSWGNHSLLKSNGSGTVAAAAISANQVVGRGATGDIKGLSVAEVQQNAELRKVVDNGTATNASMTLLTLSQTPAEPTKVRITFNGLVLKYTTDFTISGTTVTAANALNIAYGGSAGDGLGFENDDEIEAVYHY